MSLRKGWVSECKMHFIGWPFDVYNIAGGYRRSVTRIKVWCVCLYWCVILRFEKRSSSRWFFLTYAKKQQRKAVLFEMEFLQLSQHRHWYALQLHNSLMLRVEKMEKVQGAMSIIEVIAHFLFSIMGYFLWDFTEWKLFPDPFYSVFLNRFLLHPENRELFKTSLDSLDKILIFHKKDGVLIFKEDENFNSFSTKTH